MTYTLFFFNSPLRCLKSGKMKSDHFSQTELTDFLSHSLRTRLCWSAPRLVDQYFGKLCSCTIAANFLSPKRRLPPIPWVFHLTWKVAAWAIRLCLESASFCCSFCQNLSVRYFSQPAQLRYMYCMESKLHIQYVYSQTRAVIVNHKWRQTEENQSGRRNIIRLWHYARIVSVPQPWYGRC